MARVTKAQAAQREHYVSILGEYGQAWQALTDHTVPAIMAMVALTDDHGYTAAEVVKIIGASFGVKRLSNYKQAGRLVTSGAIVLLTDADRLRKDGALTDAGRSEAEAMIGLATAYSGKGGSARIAAVADGLEGEGITAAQFLQRVALQDKPKRKSSREGGGSISTAAVLGMVRSVTGIADDDALAIATFAALVEVDFDDLLARVEEQADDDAVAA